MIFTAADYDRLRALVFRDDYPGYRPEVVESPHGDGVLDAQKRYAHVATKYLGHRQRGISFEKQRAWDRERLDYLQRATAVAVRLVDYNLEARLWPCMSSGCLRVLEYPPGATSALHTDFDLFTINLWRSCPNPGLPPGTVHMGELGEVLGLGPATPHSVTALDVPQYSLVYFAIPDHAAMLPSGQTVGDWIAERIKRSRYDVK